MCNKIKFLISLLILSLIIFSCGKTENSDTGNKEKTTAGNNKDTVQKEQVKKPDTTLSTKPGKPEIKWEVTPAGTGKYDTPINDVNLIVNGKKYFIEKEYYNFYETPRSDFKTNNIPDDALISCRGWWAGAGADYWVLQNMNEVIVMKRDIGETTDENGEPGDFEGKPVKVTSIKLN